MRGGCDDDSHLTLRRIAVTISYVRPPPGAKVAARDKPQRLRWGQMNERNNQQMKANLAQLKDLIRNALQEWYLHCR